MTQMIRRKRGKGDFFDLASEVRKRNASPQFLHVENFGEKGHGIITDKDIAEGQYVLHYIGEEKLYLENDIDDTYVFEMKRGRTTIWLDATKDDGSYARLINDEHKHPNLKAKICEVDGHLLPVFFAQRHIKKGEELTYNYGPGEYQWRKKKKDKQAAAWVTPQEHTKDAMNKVEERISDVAEFPEEESPVEEEEAGIDAIREIDTGGGNDGFKKAGDMAVVKDVEAEEDAAVAEEEKEEGKGKYDQTVDEPGKMETSVKMILKNAEMKKVESLEEVTNKKVPQMRKAAWVRPQEPTKDALKKVEEKMSDVVEFSEEESPVEEEEAGMDVIKKVDTCGGKDGPKKAGDMPMVKDVEAEEDAAVTDEEKEGGKGKYDQRAEELGKMETSAKMILKNAKEVESLEEVTHKKVPQMRKEEFNSDEQEEPDGDEDEEDDENIEKYDLYQSSGSEYVPSCQDESDSDIVPNSDSDDSVEFEYKYCALKAKTLSTLQFKQTGNISSYPEIELPLSSCHQIELHEDKIDSQCTYNTENDEQNTTSFHNMNSKNTDYDLGKGMHSTSQSKHIRKLTSVSDLVADQIQSPFTEDTQNGQNATSSHNMNANNPHTDSHGLITVLPTNNTEIGRKWDKKYYCPFCDKAVAKMPRHFLAKHQDEPEIKDAFNADKETKLAKLARLRNLGTHHHNCEVLRKGVGTLIVTYRPKEPCSPEDYGPCEQCYGYLVRKDLWKHKCALAPKSSIYEKRKCRRVCKASKLLLPPPSGASEALNTVLHKMTNDDVSRAVKSDRLLLQLGQKEFLKLGHNNEQHAYIRMKCREMGRLLLQVRQVTDEIGDLESFIDPTKFSQVVNAARIVAGFNEKTHTYQAPSLALKIGHSLKKCAMILKGEALERYDLILEKKADSFHQLCELKWTEEVSAHALRTLYQNKRNKSKVIPLTEDVCKLSNHLKETARKQVTSLRAEHIEGVERQVAFDKLNSATLAAVLLFNRRRQGEASKMKLDDYKEKKKVGRQGGIVQTLSKVEQALCEKITRVELVGKRGNTVPVLFTEELIQWIDVLLKNRVAVGIPKENAYVFARSHYGSYEYIRAADCLRQHSIACGAVEPETLRSTNLRRQIATLSQIMSLKENELDILAKFLGHDIRIHREYYRLPEETLQVAKLTKLLLTLEKGTLNAAAGKSLDDIQLDENEDADEDSEVDDNRSDSEVEPDSEDLNADSHVTKPAKSTNRSRVMEKRRPWTTDEKDAVLRHLQRHIMLKRIPGKQDIENCISKEDALKNRPWHKIKDFCRNAILKSQRK